MVGPCLGCGRTGDLWPGRDDGHAVYCDDCHVIERLPSIGAKTERRLSMADLDVRGITDLGAYKRRNHA